MVLFCFRGINKSIQDEWMVNNFLLAGDKFMPEMHLRQLGFTSSGCGLFTKNKDSIKLKKQESHHIFIKRNQVKFSSWHSSWRFSRFNKKNKKLLKRYYVIKHLIMLKIQNMMIIKEVLLQLFVNIFDKKIQVVLLNLHGQILQ